MDTRTVTVVMRFKADGKWARRPAAVGNNGRIKPNHVVIDGNTVPVSDGVYELRHYEDRAVKYVPVGKLASVADTERLKLERTKRLLIEAEQINVQVILPETTDGENVTTSAKKYVNDLRGRNCAGSTVDYTERITGEFISVLRRKNKSRLDQITRQDFFDFYAKLRDRELTERTIHTAHSRVASWLIFSGVDKGVDPKKRDGVIPPPPKFEKKLPTIYTPDQLESIFEVAVIPLRIAMLLAFKCGLREQEISYLQVRDLYMSLPLPVLRITAKPHLGFNIKDWEQRDVPITEDLAKELVPWCKPLAKSALVVGTRQGKPNSNFLRSLKRFAKNNNLNCNLCDSCIERNECEEFTLHKFRRTYITTILRSDIDVRTVQAYAGHNSLNSTMRYLRPAEGQEAHRKMNAVKWF